MESFDNGGVVLLVGKKKKREGNHQLRKQQAVFVLGLGPKCKLIYNLLHLKDIYGYLDQWVRT